MSLRFAEIGLICLIGVSGIIVFQKMPSLIPEQYM